MKNAMNFRPVGLMLLSCLIPLWAFAQSVMVKGVVKDTSGEAIIGASVLEKGTTNGTITDFDGNFALNVSKNAVLVVSFVGYKNEEIPVAGKSSLKITLKEDSKALEEVVVVGYGTSRKKDLAGSISSVKLDDSPLTQLANVNALVALSSKIPGFNYSPTTDAGGDNTASMTIRGMNSIITGPSEASLNKPLLVVDGSIFNGSINEIAMTDVESIDVLKDASSAAIYGSRSANGVIIITTKSGAKGQNKKASDGNGSK